MGTEAKNEPVQVQVQVQVLVLVLVLELDLDLYENGRTLHIAKYEI